MKNDRVLTLQYGNIPYLSMVRELDQERTARKKAEDMNEQLLRYFAYLNTLDEFKPLLVKLRKQFRTKNDT